MKFDSLHEADPNKMDKSIIRLQYTYYRFFIEFLIKTYGLEKLQHYLKLYISDPYNYKSAFLEVFYDDLDTILYQFENYIYQYQKL